MHVMLLFLSITRGEDSEKEYISDLKDCSIKGVKTSDAPTRYFLQYTMQQGTSIDKIVCVTSEQAYAGEFLAYQKMVKEYCVECNMEVPEIVNVAYDFEMENPGNKKQYEPTEKIKKLYDGIVKEIRSNDKVYIDYTGGFRDISFLMTVLIRYLEFIGATCEKIIYSNFQERKIVDIHYIYELIHIVNGISEFMQNGNSTLLRKAILDKKNIIQKYPEIIQLLDAMKDFSDMIALCIVDKKREDVLDKLYQAINAVHKIDVDMGAEEEIVINMLQGLLEEIQKKLLLNSREQKFSYLKIIRWCLDNNMIQQAITFYIEKVPEIYYEKNRIDWIGTKEIDNISSAEYSKQFYDILYDEIGKEEEEVAFIAMLNKISEESNINRYIVESYVRGGTETKKIKEGLQRICNYLNQRFLAGGKKFPVHTNQSIYEWADKKITGKTYDKAWNQIKNDVTLCAMFFRNEIPADIDKKKTDKRSVTYAKKIRSIKLLNEKQEYFYGKINNKDLQEILEYYLVLKVIRNQINHASESKKEDIQVVKDYLREKNKGYSAEIQVDNIKNILEMALDKTEELVL